ncbi:MAG: TIGR02281 family clan AA aspartic protease [Gammaproteobacteria bacterium]|nr:MAG: TIGR02281 family clan AA aspartic protease [Gammaproteobacteria bacterium]
MYKYASSLVSFLIFSIVINAAQAEISHIEVMALFKNKAMVSIDDEQHLLKVGEIAKLGVKLIEASSKYAVLEVNGERSKYNLGNRVRASYSKTLKKKVQIYRDGSNMFRTVGSINGYPVDFLVDTGATSVALNSAIAKRLGLQYKLKGEKTIVSTASGKALAYSISLDQVKIGEIMLRNIDAVVIEGNSPTTPLLGMSYLGRLKLNNENQYLELEEKY